MLAGTLQLACEQVQANANVPSARQRSIISLEQGRASLPTLCAHHSPQSAVIFRQSAPFRSRCRSIGQRKLAKPSRADGVCLGRPKKEFGTAGATQIARYPHRETATHGQSHQDNLASSPRLVIDEPEADIRCPQARIAPLPALWAIALTIIGRT